MMDMQWQTWLIFSIPLIAPVIFFGAKALNELTTRGYGPRATDGTPVRRDQGVPGQS